MNSFKKRNRFYQILLNMLFAVICFITIFPLLLVVSISLSAESDVIEYGYRLIPMKLDLSAYQYVFLNSAAVLNAYKVTAIFSVFGTFLSVFVMAGLAFALSKRNLPGKNVMSFYIFFTMLFSGGLVPSYILITNYLHLADNMLVYILPALVSPWYVFMMRTFFTSLPYEMTESAQIDGANEYMIFFEIVLPLSKSVLATVALLTFLGKWNDWFTSMMYINDEHLYSLQFLLQKIMNNIKMIQEQSAKGMGSFVSTSEIPSETARMAMAIVVAGPALVVFPFFQKYFVKGMTVGAVKG